MLINSVEYFFPVLGGPITKKGGSLSFSGNQIYGSAFYLSNNNFITAGHVLREAETAGSLGIGYFDGDDLKFFIGVEHEIITEFDVGIVKAKVPTAKTFKWSFNVLPTLEDVECGGYPYALELERLKVFIRGLKGYIVASSSWPKLESNPNIYELSFQCPRGLSGAPLIVGGDEPTVYGVVIGNKETKMLVFREEEKIVEKKETTIVERYESLSLGVAIQSNSLASIKSKILGGTLVEYVKDLGLQWEIQIKSVD